MSNRRLPPLALPCTIILFFFLLTILPRQQQKMRSRQGHLRSDKLVDAKKWLPRTVEEWRRRARRRADEFRRSSEEKWARSIPDDDDDLDSSEDERRRKGSKARKRASKTGLKKTKKGKALASQVVEDELLITRPKKRKKKASRKRKVKTTRGRKKEKKTKTKKTMKKKSKPRGGVQPQPVDDDGDGGEADTGDVGKQPPNQQDQQQQNNNNKKGNSKAQSVLKTMIDLAIKGATDSNCQWCAVQFLEKAMLGPFAPLTMFANPKSLKRVTTAIKAGKTLLANQQMAIDAAKKASQVVGNMANDAGKSMGNTANKVKNMFG